MTREWLRLCERREQNTRLRTESSSGARSTQRIMAGIDNGDADHPRCASTGSPLRAGNAEAPEPTDQPSTDEWHIRSEMAGGLKATIQPSFVPGRHLRRETTARPPAPEPVNSAQTDDKGSPRVLSGRPCGAIATAAWSRKDSRRLIAAACGSGERRSFELVRRSRAWMTMSPDAAAAIGGSSSRICRASLPVPARTTANRGNSRQRKRWFATLRALQSLNETSIASPVIANRSRGFIPAADASAIDLQADYNVLDRIEALSMPNLLVPHTGGRSRSVRDLPRFRLSKAVHMRSVVSGPRLPLRKIQIKFAAKLHILPDENDSREAHSPATRSI